MIISTEQAATNLIEQLAYERDSARKERDDLRRDREQLQANLREEREAHAVTRSELRAHEGALDAIRATCVQAGIPEETTSEAGTTTRWSTPHLVERLAEGQRVSIGVDHGNGPDHEATVFVWRSVADPEALRRAHDQEERARRERPAGPEAGDVRVSGDPRSGYAVTAQPGSYAAHLRDLLTRVQRQAVDAQYRGQWAEAAKLLEQERLILTSLWELGDPGVAGRPIRCS